MATIAPRHPTAPNRHRRNARSLTRTRFFFVAAITGFVLLPWLGLQKGIAVLTLLNLVCAALVAFGPSGKEREPQELANEMLGLAAGEEVDLGAVRQRQFDLDHRCFATAIADERLC